MTRLTLPLFTAAAVFLLGNALAAGDWLAACLAAAIVLAGIVKLAPQSEMQP
jgi:hypothetical protein